MLFVPPSMPSMIPEAFAQTPLILILESLPSKVQEGDTITFSGILLTADQQYFIPGAQIGIYDNVSLGTDTLIGIATTSDTDGIFTFTWKAVPRAYSGNYQFYAEFFGTSDYGKARSQEYRLSVTPTAPAGPTPTLLILNQVPSTAQEGDTITFSGRLLTADQQYFLSGYTIYIKDNVSLGKDTVIGKAITSDTDGTFTFTWKAVPRAYSGNYQFYAEFFGTSDAGKARSQEYRLSVTPTAPAGPTPTLLILNQIPSTAQEGDTITFSGQLLTKDRQFFISGAQIAIRDNVSLGTDRQIGTVTTSDTDGTFTFTWKAVPRIYSGDYQFYAETLYSLDYEKARSQEYRLSVTPTAPAGPTPTLLILNQIPSTAQEGDTITFSGQLLTKDRQFFISGAQIAIRDNVSLGTDRQIGTVTTSDTDGTFTFTWKAVPRIYSGDYQFYAETLYSLDYEKARSQEYRLSVTPTAPVGPTPTALSFAFMPTHPAQEGDTITFSGRLLTADQQYFLSGYTIYIKDNVSLGTDTVIGKATTSDTDGTFTFTWKAVPRAYSGNYQFYAEFVGSSDYGKTRSQEYRLSVTPTAPVGPTPTALSFAFMPTHPAQEGDTITFSGRLLTADQQYFLSGYTIYIKDNVSLGTDTVIGKATTSDTDGTFTFTWKAVPRAYSGNYQFYAEFVGSSDYGKTRSQEYRLSVTPTAPVGPTPTALSFAFTPTHPAQEGDTITFSGQLLTKDQKYFIPNATIYIKDNVSLGTDTVIGKAVTQDQGIFTFTWKAVPRDYSGNYQFYAEFVGSSDYGKARSQEYGLSVTAIAPTAPTINVSTDKTSYQSGDTIYVSGKITNPIEGKDVTITVTAPSGNIVVVDQVTVPNNGIFQIKFVFDRQDTGTYTVRAAYVSASDGNPLTFKFTKSQIESSSTILVLDPIPSKVKPGDTISLTGKLTDDLGKPIAGRIIHLIDGTTNKSVFSKSTTSDGKIEIVWTVGRGDETYSWYMFFEGDNQFESASSKIYSGVVTSVSLYTELYFQPLANKIESGQTVKFSGQLSLGGIPLAGKTIYIKDDVSLGTDRTIKTITTNSNGEFTASWTAVPRSDGGSYDFYAIFEGDTEANKVRSAIYPVYVSVTQVFEQIRVFTFDDDSEESVFEVGDVLRVIGTATPNEKLQVALMDSNQNVISQKTISVSSTGSYDTVLLTWQTSARLGFGEYIVIVWSQVDERYDYSHVSFIKSEPETYQTKISLNRPPSSVIFNQPITFTGQLQTIDGSPLKGATVGIATISEYTQNPESLTTGITDSSGRFSLTWQDHGYHTVGSTMPVYAYFVGSQVFEYSVSNQYSITVVKPSLSVYTEKSIYETGESLQVYGYGNSGDIIKIVLKSPTGQVVSAESTTISSDGGNILYIASFGTLPSNLSTGIYTVTATSLSSGISASTVITIKSAAVFETIDIVGDAYFTDYGGKVPLEGIKTVLTVGASQRVDYTDASGNFEFVSIKFDSQVDYLLHFEMTDGKSFNFVDSQIYNIDDYDYDKNPPIIKSNTMRLLLDNTIAVNQFSLDLYLNMPARYSGADSWMIGKVFEYQTKVVKFYNKVLNERPPLINVFLFTDGSWYQPTVWNPNTRSVDSHHWQPHIAISGNSWSAVGMEYTHYAQDYAYQKMHGFDGQPEKGNHLGFSNPSTGDSWIEGVGSFMPAAIADWYSMSQAGTFSHTDLEDNRYKPNSNYFNYGTSWLDEELSIATLLWDLYDKRQDGENIVFSINEIWNLIKAYDNFENYNPKYDYKKKYNYTERFSSNDRHIKYFKDFYEYMSDYDVNHDGRVDSSDQRMVDNIFALHGIPNGLTDPNRSDRV